MKERRARLNQLALNGDQHMSNVEWAKTEFSRLMNIDYPIVQGPFGGGHSSVALAATVSGLGGMGSFGCQPCTAGEIVDTVRALRQATDKPFNLNLWVSDRDPHLAHYGQADYEKLTAVFKSYFDLAGIEVPRMPTDLGPRYENQLEAIFETKPAVFSFVYGIPSAEVLERCRRNGTRTVGAATTVDEAVALEKAGVDAIVATGFEAGGHRVSFLRTPEDSLTGLFALIPQVADSVSIPVIAAGGIADARGIKAALALGADAVQIGTAFLATDQSNAPADHKAALFSIDARDTTLTNIFSGRLARGIRSRMTDELKHYEQQFAPYPLQGKFIAALRAGLTQSGRPDYITHWSGQCAPLLRHRDAGELFRELVRETSKLCA